MLKLIRGDQVQYAEGVVADYLKAQGWTEEVIPEPEGDVPPADNPPTPEADKVEEPKASKRKAQ